MNNNKLSVLVLSLAGILGVRVSASAGAQVVGGVNLASAGPNHWGILTLGGSGVAGFGTQGTQLSINGPGAGVYGNCSIVPDSICPNIGIAGTGQASGWGGGTPQPTVDGTLYYTSSNTGINTDGVTIEGGTVENNSLLATAASDASNGLAAALSLSCNMGALCGTAITSSGTNQTIDIAPVNPGGQNVLVVSKINLGNHDSLLLACDSPTVSGGRPCKTNWVVVVEGNLTMNSGIITWGEGMYIPNVLIIVEGSVATSGGLNNESEIEGVLIVPTMTAHFSPGKVVGEVIVGGKQVTFVSGGSVTASD